VWRTIPPAFPYCITSSLADKTPVGRPLLPLFRAAADQWTAQNLGIRHFAVRHDEYSTAPNEPKVDYPEGFQGTGITVKGEVVAQLIDDRLAGKI